MGIFSKKIQILSLLKLKIIGDDYEDGDGNDNNEKIVKIIVMVLNK